MLDIITTIAYHPKGINAHLHNLRWALDDVPFRIHVFSFDWNVFPDTFKDINFIYSSRFDNHKNRYFNFYENFLPPIIKNTDSNAILFMQQDIFFHKKISYYYNECIDTGSVIVQNLTDYFSLYGPNKEIVYPRIWEGATMIPTRILKKAIQENIQIGNSLNRFKKDLHNKYKNRLDLIYHIHNDELIKMSDFLHSNITPPSDKLFELTLFCYFEGIKYIKKDDTVHFQGPDKTHRLNPDVYNGVKELMKSKVHPRQMNNCLFMYELSGVYNSQSEKKVVHCNHTQFKNNLLKLSNNANEWMTSKQLDVLSRFINKKPIPLI